MIDQLVESVVAASIPPVADIVQTSTDAAAAAVWCDLFIILSAFRANRTYPEYPESAGLNCLFRLRSSKRVPPLDT